MSTFVNSPAFSSTLSSTVAESPRRFTRRGLLAALGLAITPAVATAAAVVPDGVPTELARLAIAYEAEARPGPVTLTAGRRITSRTTNTTETEAAETAMIASMRHHKIGAVCGGVAS